MFFMTENNRQRIEVASVLDPCSMYGFYIVLSRDACVLALPFLDYFLAKGMPCVSYEDLTAIPTAHCPSSYRRHWLCPRQTTR